MPVNLSPVGGAAAQFFDDNGAPLSGGLLYTYLAGTTTPQVTYTSSSGLTPHSNPIVLNAAGRVATGEIWLAAYQYKFVLKTSAGVLIATWDNITGFPAGNTSSYQTAVNNQTVFTGISYVLGNNSLSVFVNGSKQIAGVNYTETSSTSITFATGLNTGDLVQFVVT